jgi:hypothetical protein|uniref:DUF2828 family protein n=1 Tax=viral metagenome TaxID=1070528 RepID=A0A6C0CK07_9ZZZZ
MAALVSALDTKNSIQYGENNHIEYSWSETQQEQICQLYFQLVRTKNSNQLKKLKGVFRKIYEEGDRDIKVLMLKMLANTRDIDEGKGEYALSLELLSELMNIDKKVGKEMLKRFVGFKSEEKPFGSWKDLKYFMNIRKDNYCIDLYVDQMKMEEESKNNSLIWKWSPREKSRKFGWIFEEIAKCYFAEFGKYDWNSKGINKAKTQLRKKISAKNRLLDTTQIKQCEKNWSNIDFNRVTSVTMNKQRGAFMNNKNIDTVDRVECKKNLEKYMEDVKSGKIEMKGKNVGMIDFVKQALNCSDNMDKDILNEQWKSNSKETSKLGEMIPLIDTSGSMETDEMKPLLSAIGLGLRVAEKSKLGKRVMTFNAKPEWIKLDDKEDFVADVKKIKSIPWGLNTDFHKAMSLILDTIVELKIPSEEVENLILAVFSDMQFDSAEDKRRPEVERFGSNTVREILDKKYHDAGIKICGKPYKVPKIVFWNLRVTDGFPVLSYHDGYAMMSGYSPTALNEFSEEGLDGLQSFTPWNMLMKTLDKERYNKLSELIE